MDDAVSRNGPVSGSFDLFFFLLQRIKAAMRIAAAATAAIAIMTLKPVFWVKGMDEEGSGAAVDELVPPVVLSVAEPLDVSELLEAEDVLLPVVEVKKVVVADAELDVEAVN